MKYQYFKVKLNLIFQDNINTMNFQNKRKLSSGKRTRHFDIKLFYVTTLISMSEVEIRYCPIDEIADYTTKPLVGANVNYFVIYS